MNLDYKMYSKYFDDIKYQGCMVLIMQVDYKVYSILRILKESYTWNDVLIRWDSHIINKIHGIPWFRGYLLLTIIYKSYRSYVKLY